MTLLIAGPNICSIIRDTRAFISRGNDVSNKLVGMTEMIWITVDLMINTTVMVHVHPLPFW